MADAQASAIAPEKRNVMSILLDIFFEPRAAFRDILASPRWWFPLVLIMVFALTFSYLFSTRVGWESMIRKQMESSGQMQNISKEEQASRIATGVKIAGVFGYVGPAIFIPLGTAVIAAVLMFVFNAMFGGAVKFQQSFGIVMWAGIPTLLSSIVAIILLFVKSPEDIDINNVSPFNPGFYLSDQTSKWLMSLASSLDLFTFWVMALIGVGFSVATKKSWLSCFLGVFLSWAVWILIKVGWVAIRG